MPSALIHLTYGTLLPLHASNRAVRLRIGDPPLSDAGRDVRSEVKALFHIHWLLHVSTAEADLDIADSSIAAAARMAWCGSVTATFSRPRNSAQKEAATAQRGSGGGGSGGRASSTGRGRGVRQHGEWMHVTGLGPRQQQQVQQQQTVEVKEAAGADNGVLLEREQKGVKRDTDHH